jgi:hypothetical protein
MFVMGLPDIRAKVKHRTPEECTGSLAHAGNVTPMTKYKRMCVRRKNISERLLIFKIMAYSLKKIKKN